MSLVRALRSRSNLKRGTSKEEIERACKVAKIGSPIDLKGVPVGALAQVIEGHDGVMDCDEIEKNLNGRIRSVNGGQKVITIAVPYILDVVKQGNPLLRPEPEFAKEREINYKALEELQELEIKLAERRRDLTSEAQTLTGIRLKILYKGKLTSTQTQHLMTTIKELNLDISNFKSLVYMSY
jgi:hypothetical protein